MRCPKCRYLSFEPEARCKNCGYELSLGPGDAILKPIEGPLSDFQLNAGDSPASSAPADALVEVPSASQARSSDSTIVSSARASSAPVRSRPAPPPRAEPTAELPMFLQALPQDPPERDDEPLVNVPRTPRPPLGVRRPTPDRGKVREKYHGHRSTEPRRQQLGLLERDLLGLGSQTDEPAPEPSLIASPRQPERHLPVSAPTLQPRAGAVRRLGAAVIDVVFIGAINAAVIWLTLEQCGLTLSQAATLPLLPLAAFLFLLDGGYLLMFTAVNGQTVGKMATNIRVVGSVEEMPGDDRVTVGQAALRALVTFPSVLALGAGFFPALAGEGRAVHDRIAHTRVVRA